MAAGSAAHLIYSLLHPPSSFSLEYNEEPLSTPFVQKKYKSRFMRSQRILSLIQFTEDIIYI